MASESEKKYDEISRRLGVVQEVLVLILILSMLETVLMVMVEMVFMLMLEMVLNVLNAGAFKLSIG